MLLIYRSLLNSRINYRAFCTLYTQGQSPEPKVREYFYYIDHQGMLFLDDARMKNFTSCFKEVKFLQFFFKRLQFNNTSRYTKEFPYVSLCGRERNYVRCDDLPIVFTQILPIKNEDKQNTLHYFSYNHGANLLMVPFEPSKIYMSQSGRIYHPGPEKLDGIGLVKSSIAIEFSKYFDFQKETENEPTHFTWENKKYALDCTWYKGKKVKSDLQ